MKPTSIRLTRLVAAVTITALATTGPLLADTPRQHPNLARGGAPNTPLDKPPLGVDRINLFNGNLLLEIPLGIAYPLSGALDYQFSLSYNASIWDHQQTAGVVTTTPVAAADAGIGWLVGFPRLLAPASPGNDSNDWIYVSEDGATHPFFSTLHADVAENDPSDVLQYTRDSTYLRMKDLGVKRYIQLPDGTEQIFRPNGTGWRLVRIRDRFGNWVHFSYSVAGVTTVFDNHGRSHDIHYRTDPAGTYSQLVDRIVVTASAGTTATYAFEYTTATIARGCHDSDPATTAQLTVPLLAGVTLPDGTGYAFAYAGAGTACHEAGRMTELTLPTLGGFAWTYDTLSFENPAAPSGFSPFLAETSAVASRSTIDRTGQTVGTWTYDRLRVDQVIEPPGNGQEEGGQGSTAGPAQLLLTVIESPLGDQTQHYYSIHTGAAEGGWDPSSYGLPIHGGWNDATGTRQLSERLLDADGGSLQLLRSRYLRFAQDGACDPLTADCANTNRRQVSQRIEYQDDVVNGVATFADDTWSLFDGVGHFRQHATSGNFGQGDNRTLFVDYNPELGIYGGSGGQEPGATWSLPTSHKWLLNTFERQTVTEGTDSRTKEFCFAASTGFLLRQRAWAGNQRGDHDVVTVNEEAAGHPAATSRYGSDLQTLDTTAALCDLALPATDLHRIERTSAHGVIASEQLVDAGGTALSFLSRDHDIDLGTGLVAASRDRAGIETTFEYDALGRTIWTRPQTGHGADVEHTYVAANGMAHAVVQTSSWSQAGGSLLRQADRIVDEFGRTAEVRTLLADGYWGVTATEYDANGWKRRVSAPYRDGDPVSWVDYLDRDALGRIGRRVQPNGDETRFAYAGARLTTREQTQVIGYYPNGGLYSRPNTRTEIRDRQGRLWQTIDVREYTDGTVETTQTEYEFTLDHRLRETRRNGQAIGHSLTFDGRGFLVAKTPNELGLEATTLSTHGPLGNPERVIRGNHDLTQTYDRAGRLLSIADTSDPSTIRKELIYGTTSGGVSGWSNGRLTSAVRHDRREQGVPTAFLGDATITETYEYHGRGGRRSRRSTTLADLSGVRSEIEQTWAYTELGDIETLTYPQCVSCPGWDEFGPERTVTYTYTNSFVTAIDGTEDGVAQAWVSSAAYHPSGLVSEVQHSNGVRSAWTYQNVSPPRLGSAQTDGHPWSTWDSGAYQYDESGRLYKLGDRFSVPVVGTAAPEAAPIDHGDLDCITRRDPFGKLIALGGAGCAGDNQLYAFSPEEEQVWELALHRDPDTLERFDFLIWNLDDGRGRPLRTIKLAWGGWSNLEIDTVSDSVRLGNRLVGSGVYGAGGVSAQYAHPPEGGPITGDNGLPASTATTGTGGIAKGAFVGWQEDLPWTKSASGFLPITGCLAETANKPQCRYGANPVRRQGDLRNGRLKCEQAEACAFNCQSCCEDLDGPDSAQLLHQELQLICTGTADFLLFQISAILGVTSVAESGSLSPGRKTSIKGLIRILCRRFSTGFIPEARTCRDECAARFMSQDVVDDCVPEPPRPPKPERPEPDCFQDGKGSTSSSKNSASQSATNNDDPTFNHEITVIGQAPGGGGGQGPGGGVSGGLPVPLPPGGLGGLNPIIPGPCKGPCCEEETGGDRAAGSGAGGSTGCVLNGIRIPCDQVIFYLF